MKPSVGVDNNAAIVDTAAAASANTANSRVLPELLYSKERKVWVDASLPGTMRKDS